MLERERPEQVVVCGPDHTHAGQIKAALLRGVDVLTEKPMVLTAAEANDIAALDRAGPASVRVAHNLRYLNAHRLIKSLLERGDIGRIRAAALDYRLRPGHGASYFRRWHRHRERSGGLELTKSTHHLDLLNWWIADRPVDVTAFSDRLFYTADSPHGVPADADIDDTLHAAVRYAGGATATYSLIGCAPWEGYELTIFGETGSLDYRFEVRPPEGHDPEPHHRIRVIGLDGAIAEHALPREDGRHCGADRHLIEDAFFNGGKHLATASEAAAAVAVGEAITVAARSGAAVRLADPSPARAEEPPAQPKRYGSVGSMQEGSSTTSL